MQNAIKYKALVLLTAVVAFSGCRKIFDLPEEKDYLSTRADYTTKEWRPTLGRLNTTNGFFNPDGSNFPMTFEIRNARFGDGRDASDMLTAKPTIVWTAEYNGLETSLAQIEAKRKVENHPVLETRGNGDFIWWPTATRTEIRPADSVVLPQNIRYIDVKITNSGGSRIIKDLAIIPQIDAPYWPDNDYDRITGAPRREAPASRTRIYNTAGVSGITGASTNQPIDNSNATRGIVRLYFRKFTTDPNGNRLRIKVLDRDSVPINPGNFSETVWNNMIHGFNDAGTALGYTMTPTHVDYRVAYPIPLAPIPTRFTAGGLQGNGNDARVELVFSRLAFGGVRQTGRISTNFQIYEKGDWEIVFHFKFVNPRFTND
ncbi:MAG: DUF5007 domain-containing protein [Pedobacter sp.]|nr:MAG: DUF5007 domain-containing protein [Pedobacter sp.]